MTAAIVPGAGRKEKAALTLVPEEERAIVFRFDVALVGVGAKSFASQVVDSEMSEAFRPNGLKQVDKMETVDEADTGEKTVSMSPRKTERTSELVVFCPAGGNPLSKELARIRLLPIEKFSDELPSNKKDVANQIVAFLFWQVDAGAEKDRRTEKTPTDDRLCDFTTRMAEINHMPRKERPFTLLLTFEADDTQLERLEAFVKKFPENTRPKINQYSDGQEDTLYTAMTDIVDDMISRQNGRKSILERDNSRLSGDKGFTTATVKSRWCVIS
jgi:hypothetical protein